jgi:hypothetical protein
MTSVQTGSLTYFLAIPSLITNNKTKIDLIEIIDNNNLIYN